MLRRAVATFVLLGTVSFVAARVCSAQFEPKDYLSEEEADKIRDAGTPSDRIKLYMAFADDRLKKFDYELNRTTPERRRTDILNGLLNAYAGCVDDGADQIAVAREKQMDIHAALKLMQSKLNEHLDELQNYEKNGKNIEDYRDSLDDAIQGTKDAQSDVEDALKEMLPAPVRRKPS